VDGVLGEIKVRLGELKAEGEVVAFKCEVRGDIPSFVSHASSRHRDIDFGANPESRDTREEVRS